MVNIITKDQQDGVDLSAQVGGYGEGDGFSQDYNLSWGVSEGRTRVVLGGGYYKQDEVFAGDRDISLFPSPFGTSCASGGCSSGTPLGRFIVSDPNTGQDLNLTLKAALPPGTRPTYIPGSPTGPASSFKSFTTLDRFNFQPFNYIVTPSERVSLFGQINHAFNDALNLRVRASYVNRSRPTRRVRCRCSSGPTRATATCSTPYRSTSPTRSTPSASPCGREPTRSSGAACPKAGRATTNRTSTR